jgi:hypothetical protein
MKKISKPKRKLHVSIKKQRKKHQHFIRIAISAVFFIATFFAVIPILQAADSPWTQTDWSGGVGASTANQYSAISDLNTSVSGQIQINDSTKTDWYNIAWNYRKKITFNNTNAYLSAVAENLTNFVVLVRLSGSNFDYSKAQADGDDLRFISSTGTVLSYYFERWNPSGESLVWVQVPSIAANTNTSYIHMYYGNNAATSGTSETGTWASTGNLAVYNMDDDPDVTGDKIYDSTSNDLQGSYTNQMTTSNYVDGQVGKAISFDGVDDYATITFKSILNTVDNNVSVGFWAKANSYGPETFQRIFFKQSSYAFVMYSFAPSGGIEGRIEGAGRAFDNSSQGWISTSAWSYIYMTYDGRYMRLYVNGVQVAVNDFGSTVAVIDTNSNLILGSAGTDRDFNGQLDQFSLSNQLRSEGWIAAEYKNQSTGSTFSTYSSEEVFYTTGTLTSNIFDSGQNSNWGNLTFNTNGLGNFAVRARTSDLSDMSNATAFGSCNTITSGSDISTNNCVSDTHRYIQYQVTITATSAAVPVFNDLTLEFIPSETTAPDVNASNVTILSAASGSWINFEPTISWTAGSDNAGGSGLYGYCISLEETDVGVDSSDLNPGDTGGKLTLLDDGMSRTFCSFIVAGTSVNLSTIAGLDLVSGKEYHFSIKAVDNAGNKYGGTQNTFQNLVSFKYDNVSPTNPSFLSLPSDFIATQDVTFIWPTGVTGAQDAHSEVAGLQYKIGDSGVWYGDLHNGNENLTDLLVNDGFYTTDPTYDYPELNEGINNVYVRTWDNAGNISIANLTGTIKINTSAPSAPRNLEVSPASNSINSFSFSWDDPLTFVGPPSALTFCYTINTLPSPSTCNYTSAGINGLNADAFANQPGTNTLYLAANETGNINYDVYTSVTFDYTGTAPGIPTNPDVADISIKTTSNWRLAFTWEEPTGVGAEVDYYKIFRSTTSATCSSNPELFEEMGTLRGQTFTDTQLTQQNYYYCVKACDNANSCSAYSSTVSGYPDGRFIEPAGLISGPDITGISSRKAVISWVTSRNSDSRVQFGLRPGEYFVEEVGSSQQVAAHTIALDNLQPGTTYFYRTKWTDEDGNIGTSEEKSFTTNPPPSVSNISASRINIDSAYITFTVKNANKVSVQYGTSENLSASQTVSTSATESTYSILLDELSDDTNYLYKLILTDLDGFNYDTLQLNQFRTIARPRINDVTIEEVKDSAQPTININWNTNVPTSSIVTFYPADNSEEPREQVKIELNTEHSEEIQALRPNLLYYVVVRGIDSSGNQAESSIFQFKTSSDSRAPRISNIIVEGLIATNSNNSNDTAQLAVSWETDEPSTGTIEYGEGTNGIYSQSIQTEGGMNIKHVLIISNLRPGSVYNLKINSADEAGNTRESRNLVKITPKASDDALELVIGRLTEIFSFIR